MLKVFDVLTRKRLDRKWDVFLWSTAAAALLGIPIAMWFPTAIPLVWLVIVGVPANSPLGPIMPTAFEPLVMEAAKYHTPLAVTLVGVAIFVYMEFINWHVYSWVLNWQRFRSLPDKRWVRWGIRNFEKRPFSTVVICAATPIPFWVARCLAILNRYDFTRFQIATAVGRFPRLYLYAWLGEKLLVPTPILLSIAVGTMVLVVGWKLLRGKKVLEDTVLDAESPPA